MLNNSNSIFTNNNTPYFNDNLLDFDVFYLYASLLSECDRDYAEKFLFFIWDKDPNIIKENIKNKNYLKIIKQNISIS